MKTNLRGLTLTALLLSASNMSFAQQGASTSIGDLPGYDEDAYFAEEATYAQRVSPVAPAAHTDEDAHVTDQGAYVTDEVYPTAASEEAPQLYAPMDSSELQPVGFFDGSLLGMNQSNCDQVQVCEAGCDGGCSSCRGSSLSSRLGLGNLSGCGSNCWGTSEALLWFTPDRDMPALITVNAPGGDPIGPTATTVFGDGIDGDLTAGFRGDYGKYVTKNIGIGGRFWIVGDQTESYSNASNGDITIGRPFFDTSDSFFDSPNPGENALLIGHNGVGLLPLVDGNIQAESKLQMWAAEAYARINLGCSSTSKLELLGGYSHFSIDDSLYMHSQSFIGGSAAASSFYDFTDAYELENRFDGGQIGFEMSKTRGRWTARSLTKVHLGNMSQSAKVQGTSTFGTPFPATTGVGGALPFDSYVDEDRDVFTFIPEANFKLSYQFRPNVALSVGYSFMYFDNVAQVGDVINPIYDGPSLGDPAQFGGQPFKFDDSSLWVQGIDLGVVINL
ncbi:BBP7 family outer membrane beta-barrel protein [Novipirellula artificiosorum]|uniref:Uncharacterized protein n=1 Tax=Novipirellula artificiosorum TaxID=2528016 RepID=A0A5C6DF73_9BACT|nr:BBP7 family outer membrane beta-barrel protein [Novipirellula artificiosorum]TWU34391.1 hypothetical protein Poly41_45390 [Novipirellula artificiosorum]